MNPSHIYYILVLKEYLTNIFGVHYPKEIVALCIMKIYEQIKINCGTNNTTLILNEKIYVWGENSLYRSGLFYNNDEYSPQKLISYEKSGHPPIQLSKIKCYHNHTIALTTQSELYVWGCNSDGQLGLGDYIPRYVPHKLLSNIKKINGKFYHRIVLTKLNEIYVWGSNFYGLE